MKKGIETKEEIVRFIEDCMIEYARVYNEHHHTLLIDRTIIDAFHLGLITAMEDVADYPSELLDEAMDLVIPGRTKDIKI